MKWISVKDQHPPFDEWVLVYCRIYGRYLGSYSRIDPDYDFGHWCDGKNYGVLPPTHWMHLPPPPHNKAVEPDGAKQCAHDYVDGSGKDIVCMHCGAVVTPRSSL